MKYILTDYAGCGPHEGDEPNIKVFKNKDDLIQQLLAYLDDNITLKVSE